MLIAFSIGVFTDRLTWRWCFWINLPLGAATALTVFFFLKLPNNERNDHTMNSIGNIKEFLNKLDLIGSLCLMPFLVCLLLALQWGGTTYAWSNWRVILCLCLFGLLFIAWIYIQYAKGDNATLPARIIRQRSVGCGLLFSLCTCSSMFVVSYYGPIWFQVVKDTTAEQSGINFLAALGPLIVASFAAGALVSISKKQTTSYKAPEMEFEHVWLTTFTDISYWVLRPANDCLCSDYYCRIWPPVHV
jgi:MFS family permease